VDKPLKSVTHGQLPSRLQSITGGDGALPQLLLLLLLLVLLLIFL